MSKLQLGPIFTLIDLVQITGWSYRRVWTYCLKGGLIEQNALGKEGGRRKDGKITISYAKLLEKDPDLYYSLVQAGHIR